ncbi:MAG: UxaA family hydrolase [Desulfobacterales bacterium]|nr:MAG: UxaA family hydrolase [Desulfobacterales bacterium]
MGNLGRTLPTALMIDAKDNVATALTPIAKGQRFALGSDEGYGAELTAREDIPRGHKVAKGHIARGAQVIKYGNVIGVAIREIKSGDHVHIHNLKSLRGQCD